MAGGARWHSTDTCSDGILIASKAAAKQGRWSQWHSTDTCNWPMGG
eukprot:CAMPEP_0168495598 /NCGR_PEP_ID=MMETSP0228-20121227/71822_1 /TAXON_ID=133427 /ORGANISM="Protoceratium reticulatum, Strain CCCM 535 (=CCMP 1889)" /LENGTH=45 /DNA_ID= /DNA_START= /DNA_END= /DNA_ORIENTATION=